MRYLRVRDEVPEAEGMSRKGKRERNLREGIKINSGRYDGMKKKAAPILVVILLIILVAAAGVLSFVIKRFTPSNEKMDGSEYFGLEQDTDVALVVNREVLEDAGKFIDGNIYIQDATVSKYINQRFYWDANNKVMLYTLPEEVITLTPDSTEYLVAGETQKEEVPMIRSEGDVFYVSLEFLKKYSDMSCEAYEDPARVVISTEAGSVQMVDASSDYEIRQKGGIKSPILTEGKKGDALYYLESMENWTKVSTSDGYTGYIRNEDISGVREEESAVKTQGLEYTSIRKDYKINLGWHMMMNREGNQELASKIEGCTGLNTISPTWYTFADDKGKLQSLASPAYVKQAHEAGIEVWGLIENINTEVSTLDVLSVTENRTKIIQQLMKSAKWTGMDGINVDFESITEDSAPHYVQFIRELSVACRKAQLVLSVDNPVPQPYNEFYNLKEQGIMADYVIIMGYDEHYSGSEEAGSVASLPFVKDGIEQTLKEVPKEKVINAIPFYTRLWTQPYGSSNITSETMGMDTAAAYVREHQMETYWDGEAGQNVAELQGDDALYQIWLEDDQSVEEKMKLIQSYDLAGVASWQLGYQNNSVWAVISKYLQ